MKLMKFSSKLIRDYLNGNLIDDDIESLENNIDFMTEVILVSGDKNIYELCSNNLKKNYEFVTFLINLFIGDKKFVNKVAINYINKEDNNLKKTELCIFLNNLAQNHGDMDEYKEVAQTIYNVQTVKNKEVIDCLNEQQYTNAGTNFSLILDEYPGSKIIQDFFASKMVSDIFSEIYLESLMHKKFKTKEDLDNYGINVFLLSIIRNYDDCLGLYIENDLELISEYRKSIKKMQERWDFYDKLIVDDTIEQYEILCDKLYKDFSYFPEEFLIYIVNKFKLTDIFEKSERYLEKKSFLIKMNVSERNINTFNLSTEENLFLLELSSIIINMFLDGEKEIIKSENKKLIKVNFGGSI